MINVPKMILTRSAMICEGEQQNLATAFLDGSQIYGGVGSYYHLWQRLCNHSFCLCERSFRDGSQIYGGGGSYYHLCDQDDHLCDHHDEHDHHENILDLTAHKYMAGWGLIIIFMIIMIIVIIMIPIKTSYFPHICDKNEWSQRWESTYSKWSAEENIPDQVGGRGPGREGQGGRLDEVAGGLLPVIILIIIINIIIIIWECWY